MAAPNYGHDLTTNLVGNDATETWDESSNATYDDGGAMVDDGNLYYINTKCVSAQFTKDGIGSIIGSIGSAITVPTDGAILLHHLWAAPPALATEANGGVRMLIGDSLGDFNVWYVSGSDAPPSPEGGWATYAVDPTTTPQGTVVGSPTAISFVGGAVSALAQARGNPHAVNAVRHGRCEQIYTAGDSSTPAVFSGYAAVDSTATTRYNLLQPIKGGYQQRGLVSLGSAATAVYFDDANVNISLADDVNVSANFNRWVVSNVNSTVKMTAVSISALGTVSKGRFVVLDDAVVNKDACTFTDMDYFIYRSNSTIAGSTYRRCGLVTQGAGTFTGCTFDKASGAIALSSDTLGSVTKCTFISDGTGHGIDLGAISTNISMNWDNTESGYTASSSSNETILVNVNNGVTLTINVQSGASTPSVYNTGTGSVNVVVGQRSLKFTLNPSITGYEYRIYDVASKGSLVGANELQGEEVATVDNQTYTYSYSADDDVAVQILGHANDYEESVTFYTLVDSDQDITIYLKSDINN